MAALPTLDQVRRAPKVLLHDHLDGGLRPTTVIELAHEAGHTLPTTDPGELARWFTEGAFRHDLVLYLKTFEHTTGVMQTKDALSRVAAECAEDLADDGVVYAEVRFAPELHIDGGLTLDEVVEAVVGFDIAGSEAGNPPTRHLAAFQEIAKANSHITIHAGEAFGLPSIWEALQLCGAERLGHGVRIVDDITVDDEGRATLGRLAAFVRDRRVPLEMCPTSNVHTGVAPSVTDHPIGLLSALRFRVTVNTDNRLMSDIVLSDEMYKLVEAFDYGWDEIQWLTINAMKSSFWPFDQRLRIIEGTIKPGFSALRAEAL